MRRQQGIWTALVVAAGWVITASAQVTTPTLEQLELLRNLSEEEREEMLRQLGVEDTGSAAGTVRRRPLTDEELRELERQRELERRALLDEGEKDRALRPEDTIIIRIALPSRDPQPPVQPGAQSTSPTTPGIAQPAGPPLDTDEPQLSEQQRDRLIELVNQVRAKNPYTLDQDGVLYLPGFGPGGIPLDGLNEEQASLRLQSEPAFVRLQVEIIRLPVRKPGPDGLEPFGYDLFGREAVSRFSSLRNVPVPADYVVGPGDLLEIQLYGNKNRILRLTVASDGRIRFPELGPIVVGGKRYSSVRADIEDRVQRQMIGVRASVSMGEARGITVFVLGEAEQPGTYTVSGLGTITTALYASRGVKRIGSLRTIQLKRQGEVVRRMDLYDLLVSGDTRDDAKLQPGDVIFIPPVGPTVAIDGEVRRPGIYELKDEDSIEDLVRLAGGLTPEADLDRASLSRIDRQGRRVVESVRLDGSSSEVPRNGDALRVLRLRPQMDAGVLLQGHVFRPGAYAFREGMRITDVIASVDELRPNADPHYILIRRELSPDRRITAVSADLLAALRAPGSETDVRLHPRDEITVFDLSSGRERVLSPLLDEMRLQGRMDRPTQIVQVEGRVRAPGEYPLEQGMTLSDLLRAGGSLADAAYGGRAELTRYRVVSGERRQTEVIDIDLAAVLAGDPTADLPLQAFDYLSIKEVPDWGAEERVVLRGEVRFPGIYPIKRGETLKSVLERAGGLTEHAFPEGAVFSRTELRRREQQQLDRLEERLQSDLAVLALRGAAANLGNAASTIQVGQALLTQLRSAEAVGRLVVDLPRVMRAEPGSAEDLVLRGGDELLVPRIQQEVTVLGEVQNATSHVYRPELGRDQYIALSGGTTRKADRGKIYVVRANGSVVAAESSNRWFGGGSAVEMRRGDTVVVPLDTERLPALPFWQSVTSIIYNLAIAAAAVNSF